MSQNTPNEQLYNLLVTKNFDVQALSSTTGKPPVNDQGSSDITSADEFRFDYVAQSGRNYGTVVILLGSDNDLVLFFGDNVGKTMEGQDKQEWFDFLHQIKQFATKNFLTFSPENISKLKYVKQGQAAISEGLFESWQGRGNMSWNGKPTEARLVIKHKKALAEDEARFRYIESIYIETADNERFKMKSRSLTAAKAMLEHVRQGGNPYDVRAQHINEIVEELSVLSRFRRANTGKILEGDTKNLVEQTDAYYKNMHSVLKHLGTSRGYGAYFESWSPAAVNEGNLVVEDIKQLFIEQTIDHRIEEALPLLARITKESNSMKEAQIFESWINNLVEGTWALPETPEQKQTLIDLMSKDFPVGADAVNATEQLYDVLGDDILFDRLQELADADADADARSVIMTRMQELSNQSPDIEAIIGQLQTTNPASDADQLGQEVAGDEQLPQEVEEGLLQDPTAPDNPVSNAIVRRILMQRTDLLAKHGPEKVMHAIDEVAEFVGDVDEIGSSDVSGWVKQVEQTLGNSQQGVTESSLQQMLKNAGVVAESRLLDESGETLDHLLDRFKNEVKRFEAGEDLDGDLYDALFDYYANTGEMPYGTMKGRTGDPYEWVTQRLDQDLGTGNSAPRLPEADNLATFVEAGSCNHTAEGEYCPEHGLEECGVMEYTGNWTNFGLEESDAISQLKRLAHGK